MAVAVIAEDDGLQPRAFPAVRDQPALGGLVEYEGYLDVEESTIMEWCPVAEKLLAGIRSLVQAQD